MSSLAGKIRSAVESDQYDLAGYTDARVTELVNSAFATPIAGSFPSMLSFKFIVGGGKLVRSRYDDDLGKYMTKALKDIGFAEDNSAAETFDSQSKFKFQHDTGQNLKFIIVFPKLDITPSETQSKSSSTKVMTPEDFIRESDVSLFKEIVQSKTQSWKQRKHLSDILKTCKDEYKALEDKMIQGVPLTAEENTKYESTNDSFDEKIAYVQGLCKQMVDSKCLTAHEKEEIIEHIDQNISSTTDETKLNALNKRKELISSITPIQSKLSNHAEIVKLHVKVIQLDALEEKRRQGNLTIAELSSLEKKTGYLEEINSLEQQSKGWFLDINDFTNMCKLAETEAVKVAKDLATKNVQKSKSTSSSSSSSGSSNSFSNSKNPVRSGFATQKSTQKKQTGFAAAFDDDSD